MAIGPSLLDELRRRYGLDAEVAGRLEGGNECDVFVLASDAGERVARVCPPWRTVAELEWAYGLAAYAAGAIPEAVAPLAARDGSRVFALGGRPVAIFPHVAGRHLDRDDAAERDEAARLLARLHQVLPAWPGARPRPGNPHQARLFAGRDAILEPADPDLDRFLAARAADPAVRRVPLHGDFYRGNLLVEGGRITGLIDWDDSRVGSLESELAWSTWELAQAPDGGLDPGRTARFLEVYVASGGPASPDLAVLVPLIRANLRREVREAARARAAGAVLDDDEYVARALRGFNALRTQRL
ncbi:MAG: phosphotransferase enzyme family protein [Longimicrobiaceae bacterium]